MTDKQNWKILTTKSNWNQLDKRSLLVETREVGTVNHLNEVSG